MQGARLRFAVANALQNGGQPADDDVVDQRVNPEKQRHLPGQRRSPDPAVVDGAGPGQRRGGLPARLRQPDKQRQQRKYHQHQQRAAPAQPGEGQGNDHCRTQRRRAPHGERVSAGHFGDVLREVTLNESW